MTEHRGRPAPSASAARREGTGRMGEGDEEFKNYQTWSRAFSYLAAILPHDLFCTKKYGKEPLTQSV